MRWEGRLTRSGGNGHSWGAQAGLEERQARPQPLCQSSSLIFFQWLFTVSVQPELEEFQKNCCYLMLL